MAYGRRMTYAEMVAYERDNNCAPANSKRCDRLEGWGRVIYRAGLTSMPAAIRAYGKLILEILEAPWPVADGRRNELAPRALAIADDATSIWRTFYDHVEKQCGPHNDLHPVQDFAAKIAEHAARIAGVLTIVDDGGAAEIGVDAMSSALTLADWYVNEAVRLQSAARTDPRLVRAQQLLDWLRSRDQEAISFREIGKLAPPPFRTKAGADEAIGILKSRGWLDETSARPRKFRLIREA